MASPAGMFNLWPLIAHTCSQLQSWSWSLSGSKEKFNIRKLTLFIKIITKGQFNRNTTD